MSSTNPNDPLMGREPLKKRKADQQRGFAKRMKETVLLPGDFRHGTSTGYLMCKCKCVKCTAWNNSHKRKR